MALATWVRDRLWRADQWSAELALIRQQLGTEPRTAAFAQRAFEAGEASEQCDPDRGRALALYLDAWRAGHEPAHARATTLALALRAYMTVAELALAAKDYQAAGAAFLDAGFPELAVEPLQKFLEARPEGASPTSEALRLQGIDALLALSRRAPRFDPDAEITDTLARAQHATGRVAASLYTHAARVARVANQTERLASVVTTATRACPDEEAVAALVETRLLEANDADELLAHYRARFERAPNRAAYVERMRAAGVELLARNLQPGLGLRLLRMSLEDAYAALLPDGPSHIAAWELLRTHAQAQRSTLDLVPLIVQALASPLSEDAALYLARLGLEIAWRDARDMLAAQPYAAMVLDFVPGHPLATAFEREVAPPAMPAMPAMPVAMAKATSRIPVLEEGQIKRAEDVTVRFNTTRPSGRLALLTPPPPRPTRLQRDTSPFPTPPVPQRAKTQERPPRAVLPIDAVVELPTAAFFSTVLRDVSISGAFVISKRQLEIGSIVTLELRMPTTTLEQITHRVNATIARKTEVGYGLQFVDPTPMLVTAIRALCA